MKRKKTNCVFFDEKVLKISSEFVFLTIKSDTGGYLQAIFDKIHN